MVELVVKKPVKAHHFFRFLTTYGSVACLILCGFLRPGLNLYLVDCMYDANNTNLTRLARCNLALMYTHCRQVGARSKEDRNLYFHHAFLGTIEHLGEGRTKNVDNFMHLTGKTIRTGRLDYKSFAAHMNPRLDSGGHMGGMVPWKGS
jgi:hypothetical protein